MDLLLGALTCTAGVATIFLGIIVGCHRQMTEHAPHAYHEKKYRCLDQSWKDDNRQVPRWYTTRYIDEDGNVYDFPLTPRPKMGREL